LAFTDLHRLRLLGELRVGRDRCLRWIVCHERCQVRVGDSLQARLVAHRAGLRTLRAEHSRGCDE
jgi:hypothetical protein